MIIIIIPLNAHNTCKIYYKLLLYIISLADVEAPGGEKWERLKSGGKQWQATPKNLPRMQRTRAIPVA